MSADRGSQVGFDDVEALIAVVEETPTHVVVTFRCPTTGVEVRADGRWPENNLMERTAKQAKRGLLSSVRNSVSLGVRKAIGSSGPLASIGNEAASQIAYGVGTDVGRPTKHSKGDREDAILTAFAAVASRFAWDEQGKRFVSSGAAQVEQSAFDVQLATHPVTVPYDRDVVARFLAAIIASDGTVDADERASFADLVPGADLDALVARPAPGAVDFEETTAGGSRDTMLLLGWAVALTDHQLSDQEAAVIEAAGSGLGLAELRMAELRSMAQRHVIDEAIRLLSSDRTPLDEIRARCEELGEQIGLGREEAARAVIRWSKRGA